jgi:hypothetical protein
VYICPLIDFARFKDLSPRHALQAYTMNQGKPFQQPINGGFTHPSQTNHLGSPMNEMSPLLGHANIPGQAMTSSPQPHHYSSPMSSQTSQTGISGPNTTPLMANRQGPSSAPSKVPQNNKRRRGSAVANMPMKEEDEEALGNPPAKLPKQSPRMGVPGRGGGPGGQPGKRIRSDG